MTPTNRTRQLVAASAVLVLILCAGLFTAHVLTKAADLIEERGWVKGGGWPTRLDALDPEPNGLCLEGGILAALGDTAEDVFGTASTERDFRSCPAYVAVQSFLDTDDRWGGGQVSADVLRQAAALMRERAEGATPGGPRWEIGPDDMHGPSSLIVFPADSDSAVAFAGADDAVHIASWHPAVALAVADWLDEVHANLSTYNAMQARHASAVAAAYLGAEVTVDA